MKKKLPVLVLALVATLASAQIMLPVDTAVVVPANLVPLVDKATGVATNASVAYNAAGMALRWNFVTTAGVSSSTAVTPTTSGVYDWTALGGGMYSMEIPDTGGGSANNDTEGYGWFSGETTAEAQFRGPIINFTSAQVVASIAAGTDRLQVHTAEITNALITAAAIADAAIDNATFAADVGSTAYATNIIALAADKAGQNGVNLTKIAGSAVSTSTVQLGVNAVQVGGATPQTAADIKSALEANGTSILDAISDVLPASTIAAATDIPSASTIATAVGAHQIGDSTLTIDQAMQVLTAFMAGESTGGGTATITFRNYADSLDRLVLTVDANGNRSATVFTANP